MGLPVVEEQSTGFAVEARNPRSQDNHLGLLVRKKQLAIGLPMYPQVSEPMVTQGFHPMEAVVEVAARRIFQFQTPRIGRTSSSERC
jgi:hypothetical protein